MNRRTQVLALAFITILLGSGIIYWAMDDSPPDVIDEPGNSDETTDPVVNVELFSTLTIPERVEYRGDSYFANLDITANTTVSLNTIQIWVEDTAYNRTGSQRIELFDTVDKGSTRLNFSLSPAFPLSGGAVISEPGFDYTIFKYKLTYNTTQEHSQTDDSVNISLTTLEPTAHDQMNDLSWSIPDQTASINVTGNQIEISSNIDTNYTLSAIFNGTGYTRIDINYTQSGSTINYLINNNPLNLSTSNYLPIGNYLGLNNFSIRGEVTAGGSISLNISMLTKSVTLFGVVADNNWNGSGNDNFVFRNPAFYIKQMSSHFKEMFNVSIIPAVSVEIPTPPNTTLIDFAEQVIDQVGTSLDLNSSEWNVGPGASPDNEGYDILLIFTNKTMDHLGVVFVNGSGAFNLAIHSRGSLNTGNYRLPPSFADNLIQHEVSHVFGAPDRFTSSSPPSIMTKSKPSDAVGDILSGTFWLYLTSWLEEDIQTMTEVTRSTYW